MNQPGFFDLEERYAALSQQGDPLEVLERKIPWESFRGRLEKAFLKQRKSPAGRKPYDVVLMLKVLVLQSLYNLSDEQTEYQIRDRLSFMRFLGLRLGSSVPDATTLWLFREALSKKGMVKAVFKKFNRYLEKQGYRARKGQIVDASIMAVPRQRNTREENKKIQEGKTPAEWKRHPERLRQKDVEARWTKKHGRSYFGYKNHINVDLKHKLIRLYEVSDAAAHDSQLFYSLLDPQNTGAGVWADSAYRSESHEEELGKKGYCSQIHYKGKRGKSLSPHLKKINHRRSRIRARVEHVFGFQENSFRSRLIRTIGGIRARAKIGMMNLAYNMKRYVFLEKRKGALEASG